MTQPEAGTEIRLCKLCGDNFELGPEEVKAFPTTNVCGCCADDLRTEQLEYLIEGLDRDNPPSVTVDPL